MTTHSEDKLKTVRVQLLLHHPFFGTLLSNISFVEDSQTETMKTNGKEIRYNPDWVCDMKNSLLRGVLAHEVMHIALGHPWRREGRSPRKWNFAADYAINPLLLSDGFKLPEGILYDARFFNMSAEEIYTHLPDEMEEKKSSQGQDRGQVHQDGEKNGTQAQERDKDSESKDEKPEDRGQGEGNGEEQNEKGGEEGGTEEGEQQDQIGDIGGCGSFEDGEDEKDEETWKELVSQAATLVDKAGRLPSCLRRLLEKILDPDIPWQVLLREYIEHVAHNDYTWSPPSRRTMGSQIVLPSLRSKDLGEVVVAIDTSGSIDGSLLNRFCAEVSSILETFDATIYVIFCDAVVHQVQTFSREDLPIEAKIRPIGGGGTDFRPVFDWVSVNQIQPTCLVYLTDLNGFGPTYEPDYPVLWVSPNTFPIPRFGRHFVMNPG